MRCRGCGAINRADMTFCYGCGEPLEELAPAPGPAEVIPRGRRARWELWIGATILVAILLVAVVDGWQEMRRQEQARHYRAGQAALGAGDIATATAAFAQAGDYHDAATIYARLKPQRAALQAAYDDGVRLGNLGAWWDAAHALHGAADIQVSYLDVLTRTRAADAQVGPLFYRRPAPDGTPALWWARADGSTPRRLPFTGVGAAPIAIAPDGRWAVYSGAAPQAEGGAGPFLLNLENGNLASLAQVYRTPPQGPARVRFRDDSRGFWWGFDDQVYYYDLDAVTAVPLSELPGAVDTRHGRLLLNRLVLPTVDQLLSRLLLSDPRGQKRTPLAEEPGEVRDAVFSDDGDFLLYVQSSSLVLRSGGRRVMTDTVVLRDLTRPAGPRLELYSEQVDPDDPALDRVRAGFVPGAATVLIYSRDGARWTLRRWQAADGSRVLLTGAALLGETAGLIQLLPGPQPRQLAVTVRDAAGGTHLNVLGLDGGAIPVEESTAGGRWLGFAPDGQLALGALPNVASWVRTIRFEGAPAGLLSVRQRDWLTFTLAVTAPDSLPVFSRDGGRVLALATGNAGPGLYAFRPDGSDPLRLVPEAMAFWTAQPAPRPLLPAPPPTAIFLDR